ncbi:cysteine-rich receptor-like protein kinase 10 isoform X2 [Lycium barbarum]|uniref:cysteine-rich receptor-like protein kinase 10 isoform X2 n=1 Tax=Lycium barbarum TaxID=112863 RepID=UPI00293EC160|nr:cysteine-rich receptor-like protein kinase 10 isoform X2 [Lycium barbarum]
MAMTIQKWLLFLFLHLHLHVLLLAQPDLQYKQCSVSDTDTYTEKSTYHKNLISLLSSLSKKIDKYGFYNASIGQNSDMVSAIVLCRGDVDLEGCRSCVSDIAQVLVRSCPNKTEAFGGYDDCMLQYSSNRSIIGARSFSTPLYMWNTEDASRHKEFNQTLIKLLDNLRDLAAAAGRFRKYASGNVTGPKSQPIFAFVQCTPDLSPQNCSDCLTEAYGDLPECPCYNMRGGRIIGARCNFRYESYNFLKHVSLEALPPAGKDDKTAPIRKDDKTARTVIIMVVVIVVILIGCISIISMKRQKRKLVDRVQTISADDISTTESLQYDFSTIIVATNNFSNANKLGQGGFGPVYKGMLPNGQEVAVKRLSVDSGQGYLKFKNEVLLVARLQHRNLVKLLGFCLDGTERLLVYEFVPNASLDHFLFDRVKCRQLDWEMRSKIIGGVARGILYLHEDSRLRIIHRDLKASNVLLDAEMNPKISDFGMARLFASNETQGNTSRIVGTYGYMAPEYAMHGKFSVKSDVFSFGVLVLEIISSQRNTCSKKEESMEDLVSYYHRFGRTGVKEQLQI